MLKLETVDNHGFRPQFLIPKIQDSSQLLSFSPLIVRLYELLKFCHFHNLNGLCSFPSPATALQHHRDF